jgi:hypothetical protein
LLSGYLQRLQIIALLMPGVFLFSFVLIFVIEWNTMEEAVVANCKKIVFHDTGAQSIESN